MKKSIYLIKNYINDKVYVGQSINPHRRFIQHLYNGTAEWDNYPIHLAIKKYGKMNFYYEILEENIENYNEREKYWISYYNSITPNGYNILPGPTTEAVFYGEKHPNSCISDNTANIIVEQLQFTNLTQRKIAELNGCSERVVNSINAGTSRRRSDIEYPIRDKFCHFSKQTLNEIKYLLKESDSSLQSIADFYGVTKGAIAQINKGNSHRRSNEMYPLRNGVGKKKTKKQIEKILIGGIDNVN